MKNSTYSKGLNNTMRSNLKRYFPLFLLPTFIAFVIGFVWPFLWGIYLSFFKFKTLKFMEFNGIRNYILAFSDSTFLYSFFFTTLFAIVVVVIINLIAFLLGYALTSNIKGTTLFRTIFFMPNLIGGIVLAYVWKQIMNDVIYRLYDSALMLDPNYGFWGLVILLSWQQIGYMMIIYIAGLQNVNNDLIEAAKIDGASRFQCLLHIDVPTILPTTSIMLILAVGKIMSVGYEKVLLMQNNLNLNFSEVISTYVYKVGLANGVTDFSLSTAIGMFNSVVNFILLIVANWSSKKLSGSGIF